MPPSSISLANRSTAATPASVVGGVVANFQSIALTASQAAQQRSYASSWPMPLSSASSWASIASPWAMSAARLSAISANAGSGLLCLGTVTASGRARAEGEAQGLIALKSVPFRGKSACTRALTLRPSCRVWSTNPHRKPSRRFSMPKVDDVAWMSQRHGFLVRQDNDQPIASFEFTNEAEAQAAQKKMQEILATCVEAMGYT